MNIRMAISYLLSYKFYIPEERISEIKVSSDNYNVLKLEKEFNLEPYHTGQENKGSKPYGFKLITTVEIPEQFERKKKEYIEQGAEPEIVNDYLKEEVLYLIENFVPENSKDLVYNKRLDEFNEFLVEKVGTQKTKAKQIESTSSTLSYSHYKHRDWLENSVICFEELGLSQNKALEETRKKFEEEFERKPPGKTTILRYMGRTV